MTETTRVFSTLLLIAVGFGLATVFGPPELADRLADRLAPRGAAPSDLSPLPSDLAAQIGPSRDFDAWRNAVATTPTPQTDGQATAFVSPALPPTPELPQPTYDRYAPSAAPPVASQPFEASLDTPSDLRPVTPLPAHPAPGGSRYAEPAPAASPQRDRLISNSVPAPPVAATSWQTHPDLPAAELSAPVATSEPVARVAADPFANADAVWDAWSPPPTTAPAEQAPAMQSQAAPSPVAQSPVAQLPLTQTPIAPGPAPITEARPQGSRYAAPTPSEAAAADDRRFAPPSWRTVEAEQRPLAAQSTSYRTETAPALSATASPLSGPMQKHIVTDGDTLPGLAKRYLGDASQARQLFELNAAVLDHPDLLPIGAELSVPSHGPRASAALPAAPTSGLVPVSNEGAWDNAPARAELGAPLSPTNLVGWGG
ncbi:LysM peptidoglycan-binding domain-containing protein [Pseudobythopirellula maris]|uniref:LysM peptidoglycan-binding domain-containing protein n=1 Tax=Pseudobythopirellula maris TaxID=2527991 RepID=UPI0011B4A3B2|nr:LysM peptidoglycan-binding domain-containing protein [Pseudobythopirellula maris]